MESPTEELWSGQVIQSRFALGQIIGRGGFSKVYQARDMKTGENVAVKVSKKSETKTKPGMKVESIILQSVGGGGSGGGFPRFHSFGTWRNRPFLAMDLVGVTVGKLMESNASIPVQTVLRVMDQLLPRLARLHSHGVIHRDIKPDNMAIGTGDKKDTIFLIDLGLATAFRKKDGHVPSKENCGLTGTLWFMSITGHLMKQQSRRDDLESLAYVALYLLRHGNLPWAVSKTQMENMGERSKFILQKKLNMTPEQIFCGQPPEFSIFLDHVRNLRFEEKPKYKEYRRMFRKLGKILNVNYKAPIQWNDTVH